ncbi:MAG: ABC transporter permease [Planctomycetes bacterium]|nr:ABC transporter permease [Planctomycetota bacterium]
MYRLFLALRYLVTRPINLLGMAGITISVWALIVVVSVFTGFIDVVQRHVHSASADIIVSALPTWATWSKLQPALRDDENVAASAPRLLHYGILLPPGRRPDPAPLPGRSALNGGDQPFLFVLGIDAAAELQVTGLGNWLGAPAIPPADRADATAPLAPQDGLPTVLIGLERMQRDGLHRGDVVVLTTARFARADDGSSVMPERLQVQLRIAGAFKTDHGGFDGNNVFVDRQTLQGMLHQDQPDLVQEIVVKVKDEITLDETAARLQRGLNRVLERNLQGFGSVMTWQQRNAGFLQSVEHQRALLKIVLIVIMVVAAFLMLATLSMMVTEKIADIGILTAMGGTPRGVTFVFLACGLVITSVGVVIGIGLGALTASYLEEIRQTVRWATGVDLFPIDVYNLDRVPCSLDALWMLRVAGMALATGVVVSAIPALRAARHDPLASLRGV